MAEKLVSPGVFTKENDLSFLQQGVAEIGAAFIGPFKEGPLTPTIVNSQAEFETLFGAVDDTYYTPLAVQNYLREAGTATICRTAGINGYSLYESGALAAVAFNGTSSVISSIIFPTDDTYNLGTSGIQSDIANGNVKLKDIKATYGTNPLAVEYASGATNN